MADMSSNSLVTFYYFWRRLLMALELLGSKTLGLNVLELHFVMLANYDQNV